MEIEVREPRTEQELNLYYDLRWRILREPWTSTRESARDEHEADAIHLIALQGGNLLGVGRLHFNSPEEAQVRYMAVENGHRGAGIGGLVIDTLEARAQQAGATRVVLNAREDAIPFYARHGYELIGRIVTPFDAVIHWRMKKDLPPVKKPTILTSA